MRVLAIDASLRNTGVAIVDANNGKPQSVYFGTIHNKTAMRPSSCLVCIRDRLAELLREHAPDCCSLESVIHVQSYKTAIILRADAGSAERNSHMRSHCRKNSLRKKGRTHRLKISYFFSNTNRFTRLGARLIDPAC